MAWSTGTTLINTSICSNMALISRVKRHRHHARNVLANQSSLFHHELQHQVSVNLQERHPAMTRRKSRGCIGLQNLTQIQKYEQKPDLMHYRWRGIILHGILNPRIHFNLFTMFSIIQWNIRGLQANHEEFSMLLPDFDIDSFLALAQAGCQASVR